MITLLISIYGELQTLLRIFIPFIVKYSIKKRSNTINNDTTIAANQISIRSKFKNLIKIFMFVSFSGKITERLLVFFGTIKNFLMNLNLFESSDRSSGVIYHQRLYTKLYLCLLFGKFI